MKRFLSSGLALAAVLSLVGCGGGSSDATNSPDSGLLTGHYVDSNVSGVDYNCSSKQGITDENGSFKFRPGDNCAFSLAGVQLREVNTTDMGEGAEVREDNISVAQLLQSLDKDGDPSNGIVIDKDVRDALKNERATDRPPLKDALKEIKDDRFKQLIKDINTTLNNKGIKGFKGCAVSIDDAQKHLDKSKEDLIKKFKSPGKLYVIETDHEGDVKFVEEVKYTSNDTKPDVNTVEGYSKYQPMDTFDIDDIAKPNPQDNGSNHPKVERKHKELLVIEKPDGTKYYLFKTKGDAEKYLSDKCGIESDKKLQDANGTKGTEKKPDNNGTMHNGTKPDENGTKGTVKKPDNNGTMHNGTKPDENGTKGTEKKPDNNGTISN